MIKQYTIRINHQRRKQYQRNRQKQKKGMTAVHFSVSSAGALHVLPLKRNLKTFATEA